MSLANQRTMWLLTSIPAFYLGRWDSLPFLHLVHLQVPKFPSEERMEVSKKELSCRCHFAVDVFYNGGKDNRHSNMSKGLYGV